MFTSNQIEILRALSGSPEQSLTMTDLGSRIGKAPGAFQRGLNALEAEGLIVSRREGRRRLLSLSAERPHRRAVEALLECRDSPLPPDVYDGFNATGRRAPARLAEPPGVYADSALKFLLIAGPNGAGKTTFAREYLPREGACPLFINADYIAHGLSPFAPEAASVKAGRLMLRELEEHVRHRRNVAIETTLSGKRYARLVPRLREQGYAVKLIFLQLPGVEIALARVAMRVRQGGHAIPGDTVRRRFDAGAYNFEHVYKPIVDAWACYDNSGDRPVLLAEEER